MLFRSAAQVPKFLFEGIEIPLKLNPTCGIFITMNPGYAGRTELPDNLKALFRPMAMMIPDYGLIAEIMLFSEGFESANALSQKMVKLYKLCSEQLSQQDHYDFGMRAVKSVLVIAGVLRRANPDLSEDIVLIRAMCDANVPKFLSHDLPLFDALIRDLFPGVEVPVTEYGSLDREIRNALSHNGLQAVEKYITKIIQLYETMSVRFGVMIVGATGTGKTRCYEMLQQALTKLRALGEAEKAYQTVNTFILNPKCILIGELYGEFNMTTLEWRDGLAASLIRECVSDVTKDRKWVVFDGPVDALWIENMNTVLDDNMTLCLANGERIKLNATMNMLFEVQDLSVASPATVSRCGMVYISEEDLGVMPYVRSWLSRQWWLNELQEEVREEVYTSFLTKIQDTLSKGLVFLRKKCKEDLPTSDVNITQSLCALFEALFTKANNADITVAQDRLLDTMESVYAFCFMWSVGGALDNSYRESFDEFVRDMFERVPIPRRGLIWDHFVNVKTGDWRDWSLEIPKFEYRRDLPYFELLVPTVDTVRYSFIMKTLFSIDKSVLITGVTGTGKSVSVQNQLSKMADEGTVLPIFFAFSAQTSAGRTQEIIESKLEKKRKNLLGAPPNKKAVLFVDDLNMPMLETYGAQPPIELLRQFQDFKGFYDRQKLFWKNIENLVLVLACGPPGGGRNQLTPRFVRHSTVLAIPPASVETLKHIFGSITDGFLEPFQPDVKSKSRSLVAASVELYNQISEELLPTPAKSHYTFNLRDLSKVIQGICMVRTTAVQSVDVLARLWAHESERVFRDRLISREDQAWFNQTIIELVKKNFGLTWDYEDTYVTGRPVLFGDFLKVGVPQEDRSYEEITDFKKLEKTLYDYLEDYNVASTNEMKLVFFQDNMEHISRISRVIRQPRGNAMLVGLGGSGKQSLSRMAAHIAEYQLFQIELRRGYGVNEFHDDLKTLYFKAGIDGIPVVFLFTDSQIVKESFLEDINNILNSGEVPNLFASDDMEKIINGVRPVCTKKGIPETRENIYNHFIQRVRDNLHIVLSMSPAGSSFRVRCRMFPSLINCCTIDWFYEWPSDALLSVATNFLSGVDVSEEVRPAIAKMCVEIHTAVSSAAEDFYSQLRRKYYTTPKSFLDLVNLYIKLLEEKRNQLGTQRDRLRVGVQKLVETNKVVEEMQAELTELQPVLVVKTAETEVLLKEVAQDKIKADQVKAVVSVEEKEVGEQAKETQIIKDDAQKDLDEALPALEASVKALNSLNKNDISEIKAFTKPPELVQVVMEAVCIMLGQKPDWDSAKKVLADGQFMKKLIDYDKDNISLGLQKKIKKYIENPNFTAETVARVSVAAKSLCMWVRAMDVYARVAKEVEPKRQRLAEMESLLKAAQATLATKQRELKEVVDRVEALQRTCDQTEKEKNELAFKTEQCKSRLTRAEKLISGLGSEQTRWTESVAQLTLDIQQLVGDVLLGSASIAYCGAFTQLFRIKLGEVWVAKCKELEIPCSDNYSLSRVLSEPVAVRQWNIWGLPADVHSTENGVMVARGTRWPLMIDPQNQANRWIRSMESKNGLKVLKLTEGNFLRTMENAIRIGSPVLLEDVGEDLDPALDPILAKQIFKQGGRFLIRLGDTDVDYDPNFKLYITTKLANPHYLPEIFIKVTIINFTVTMRGLEDQLLGAVVRKERPELEEQKDRLIVSMAADKKQLKELEDKILQLLSASEGNILDDEVLISTLNESKVTSGLISSRLVEAEETEKNINAARELYRAVALRGSILYFVVADLALIDPMYQYSLAYFTNMFNLTIDTTPKSDDLDVRLKSLMECLTINVYLNVCRGLFEKHKSIFSLLICVQIMRDEGLVDTAEWMLLLRGVVLADKKSQSPNPDKSLVSEAAWDIISELENSKESALAQLRPLISENLELFRTWATTAEPHVEPLPCGLEDSLSRFQKLIVLKCFREEKLVFALQNFVRDQLGKTYISPPPFNLESVFKDTSFKTPIIFILSTGADPTSVFLRFAKQMNYDDRLHVISLGQGQGPVAARLIEQAVKTGDWVLLQNCHLAVSWMTALEKIVLGFGEAADGQINPDFRLWLTSMPSEKFPVSVLQNGVKLTNEPPKGLRANLIGSYAGFTEEEFNDSIVDPNKRAAWRSLLFGLSFFHASIQERRKFGPLGWNIRYEFNQSDLDVSIRVLRNFLNEYDEVLWKALLYVTGEINYGGRVTDDWDRRCLNTTLRAFYRTQVMEPNYRFSSSDAYRTPEATSLQEYRDFIEELPFADDPAIFGMHQNANISFQNQETQQILQTVLSIQPRASGAGAGASPEEIVSNLAASILSNLPAVLTMEEAGSSTFVEGPSGAPDSLSTVLSQEMERFNRLLVRIRSSLVDLQKAIKGIVVMSQQLDAMYSSMLNNMVPALWAQLAYPSLKPLGSWVKDLHQRVAFMRDWVVTGEPMAFWISGFFFPQGFMTGTLQRHARKYQIPIDTLNFSFKVLDIYQDGVIDRPTDGVYVYGMFMDGGRWDPDARKLVDPAPGEMNSTVPVVHFQPAVHPKTPAGEYQCPLYKTSVRAGVLSTTGQSTNFVLAVDLPSDNPPDHWVLRGSALLCQLNE